MPSNDGDGRRDHEPREQSSPQLLERTIMVLSLFNPDRPEWTTTEIGRACGLAVPTVHRILGALHRHDFVVRDPVTKRFRLGPAILQLGRAATVSSDLRAASLPALQALAASTGETTLLTGINEQRDMAVCLERVESSQPLRLSIERGRLMPLHAGAGQKVLLAFMPEHEIERVLSWPLAKLCDATIDDPKRLREELKAIRERGWAASFEETNVGVWGLAMALLDEHGHAVAGVGIAGPQDRWPSSMDPWIELLAGTTAEIAAAQALKPSYPPTTGHRTEPSQSTTTTAKEPST